MKAQRLGWFLGFLGCWILLGVLPAKAQDENALEQQVREAYTKEDYVQAERLAGSFVQQFPKSPRLVEIKAILGLSQIALGKAAEAVPNLAEYEKLSPNLKGTGQYYYAVALAGSGQADKAIPVLQKLLAPVLANKKIEDNDPLKSLYPVFLLTLSRTAMEEGSKKEQAKNPAAAAQMFTVASQSLTALQSQFPGSEYKTEADLTKATLAIYQKQYEQAEADLKALKSGELGGVMAEDLDYLLGFVYSQRAQVIIGEKRKAEAVPFIEKARGIYQKLAKSGNLSVASDAAFQLANLAVAAESFREAIDAYRSLPTRAEVVESQKQKLARLREEVTKSAGNASRVTQLQSLIKREQQKLKAVESGPDLTMDALGRIADCYLALDSGDEARVILRHLMAFDENADRKKEYQIRLVISFATQNQADKAETAFAEFKKAYPNDPSGQTVDYLIANAMFQQKQYDAALRRLEKNLKEFPNSPVAAQIPALMAEVYKAKGEPDKAIQTFRQFIQDGRSRKIKVEPEVVDQAQYSLAQTLFNDVPKDEAAAAKQKTEAAEMMKQLSETAVSEAMKEEAALQAASFLSNLGKTEESLAAYRDFLAKFPNSSRKPSVQSSIAAALERSNKLDDALAAYRDIIADGKDAEQAVFAYDRVWRILQSQGKAEEAVKVQDELVQKFPNHPRAIWTLLERAKQLKQNRENDKAVEAFLAVYDYCKKLEPSPKGVLAENASFAIISAADVRRAQAKAMGNFAALDDEKKKQWAAWMDEAEGYCKKIIAEFPTTPSFNFALNWLVDISLAKIQNGLTKYEDALNFLSRLAGELDNKAVAAQVLIARANLVYETGSKAQAKTFYEQALNQIEDPKKLSWNDYGRYADILVETGDFEKALKMGQLIRENFTDGPNSKIAQSAALYTLGVASSGLGKTADAETYFKELKEKYPGSPKILQADLYLGESLAKGGKEAEGLKLLKEVLLARKPTDQTAPINSRAMMAMAQTLFTMADAGKPVPPEAQEQGKPPIGAYDLAANYYLKVEGYYGQTLPALGAECLFHVVEIRLKQNKKAEAQKFYQEMTQKFPTSPWTPKAKEVLGQ